MPDATLKQDSFFLLQVLNQEAKTYQKFAAEYFEVEISDLHIDSIYRQSPMTHELAAAINAQVDYSQLVRDLAEIGYPVDC